MLLGAPNRYGRYFRTTRQFYPLDILVKKTNSKVHEVKRINYKRLV